MIFEQEISKRIFWIESSVNFIFTDTAEIFVTTISRTFAKKNVFEPLNFS